MKWLPIDELEWKPLVTCTEGLSITTQWDCIQYPDLFVRVHYLKDSQVQFHQVFVRGCYQSFPTIKAAYRRLKKRGVRRVGKNKQRRDVDAHGSGSKRTRHVLKKSRRRLDRSRG